MANLRHDNMRFFQHANYPFVKYRFLGYLISGFLITISIVTIFVRGLQYGIDFKGGTDLIISCNEEVNVSEIRTLLSTVFGTEPQVRVYGSPTDLQIRTDVDIPGQSVAGVVSRTLSDQSCTVLSSNQIGPIFARDIQEAAFKATIFSIIVIGVYILVRFKEPSFMIAVILTLVHDTLIIVGIFTLLNGVLPFDMDVDQNLVAALLTIIGYSMNDTIVVFDRIRENRNLHRGKPLPELVNLSINQTMSRTVVTSLTTLFVVVVLFLFGGDSLRAFSFALTIGVILGTYSTVFFACPMVVDLPKEKISFSKKKTSFPKRFRSEPILHPNR